MSIQITAIKKGKESAFVEVYNLLHVRMFRYFLKKTQSNETARELTQQTFIKLWQSRHTLSELYAIDTQCFTIANSVLVDYLRKEASERKYQLRFYAQHNNITSHICYANEVFESTNYLQNAAENLPPVRKNIFLLKMIKGYSNQEIADQLSISVKTVEDHYSKAIRHLRSASVTVSVALLIAESRILS